MEQRVSAWVQLCSCSPVRWGNEQSSAQRAIMHTPHAEIKTQSCCQSLLSVCACEKEHAGQVLFSM